MHPNRVDALTTFAFDFALCFWRAVLSIFFRSIEPRGAWRIPVASNDDGSPATAVIFAGAPHHNQFLDPLLLSSEAKRASGRRVSFLTAEKSLKRKFIGPAARMMGSISVVRAADRSKPGVGCISFWPAEDGDGKDGLRIKGYGTQFTKQLQVRGQLVLPKSYGSASAEVEQVVSDTECILKRPFKDVPSKLPVQQALAPTRSASTGEAENESLIEKSSQPGTNFIVFPHIDQSQMYAQVFEELNQGGSLGIFPEGGSHDRTDLLPLKRGVVIMALGAIEANPKLKVRIVPVGLAYFHPHKFRSRAVVEFGSPIEVPSDLVKLFAQGGEKKREAVEKMMDIVYDGLKSVTVRAPDYETLQLIQAGRRLYVPPGMAYGTSEKSMLDWEAEQQQGTPKEDMTPSARTHLNLGQVVDLNRRFIIGYLRFQNDPRVQRFKASVLSYNRRLIDLGLRDHQVEKAQQASRQVVELLLYRIFLLCLWGSLALPGFILNLPIFIVARSISHKKAKIALAESQVKLQGRDVLATWKVLVSLGMAPILYSFYAVVLAYYLYTYHVLPSAQAWWLAPLSALVALPLLAYCTIKFGEAGLDIYKSLPPLVVSLIPGRGSQIESLKQTRRGLAKELSELIDELAPQIWPDYNRYKQTMIDRARRDRQASVAAHLAPHVLSPSSSADSKLALPGAWIDDATLFGWRAAGHNRHGVHGIHSPFLSPRGGPTSPASPAQSRTLPGSHPSSNVTAKPNDTNSIPELVLPLAASDSSDSSDASDHDDDRYQDAMDRAATEVGDYANSLTLAAREQAQTKAKRASSPSSLTSKKFQPPSLTGARQKLSHSISRLFPPKTDPEHSSVDPDPDKTITQDTSATTTAVPEQVQVPHHHHMRTRTHTLQNDIPVSELRARIGAKPEGVADHASTVDGNNLAHVPFDQAANVLDGHPGCASSKSATQKLTPLRAIPQLDDIPQASRTPSRPASPARD